MVYTNEVVTKNGVIIAKIFVDGNRSIEQTFDPNGPTDVLWASVEQAQEWADAFTIHLQANSNLQEEEAARKIADSQRLVRIEALLEQLANPTA